MIRVGFKAPTLCLSLEALRLCTSELSQKSDCKPRRQNKIAMDSFENSIKTTVQSQSITSIAFLGCILCNSLFYRTIYSSYTASTRAKPKSSKIKIIQMLSSAAPFSFNATCLGLCGGNAALRQRCPSGRPHRCSHLKELRRTKSKARPG